MLVRWITAFVDRPSERFDTTVDFWSAVSRSTISAWRGDHEEFATFCPVDGSDPHLRVQRTTSALGGSHIDLHVDDVAASVAVCVGEGARLLADRSGFTVLASPGNMPFCVVPHHGERTRQQPMAGGGVSTLVDQVSIDADPDTFDAELRFWSTVTGWRPGAARAPEFTPLERPASMPLRILLQQRAVASGSTSCHLDLASDDRAAAVSEHTALGAKTITVGRFWTVMADPSGVAYCLTDRLPSTGMLAPLT